MSPGDASSGLSLLTFEAFEKRVETEPDLELNWMYWNVLLSETGYLWILVFLIHLKRLGAAG